MTPERWQEVIAKVEERFTVTAKGTEPLDGAPGMVEFVECDSPLGKLRLEFVTRPVVTGTRGVGGHKVGAAAGISYEYSDTDSTHSLRVYRHVNGAWEEIDGGSLLA